MTLEEKLEKLTERHEALAQSLELLRDSVHEQGDNIEKQGRNIDRLITLAENQTKHTEVIFEALKRLTKLADSHDGRIHRLESEA
jgi:hypothetical protein